MATGLPGLTLMPPTGSCLMTVPAGTVVLVSVVTVTVRPAVWMAETAALCERPTTSGTVASKPEPEDTTMAMALPGKTLSPAVGFWLMTVPAGTAKLAAVVTVAVRPAA